MPDPILPALDAEAPPGAMADDDYFDDRWTAGSLPVADTGCGWEVRLVVTGPARGTVWEDGRPSDGGLVPLGTFREWYESWLHEQQTG